MAWYCGQGCVKGRIEELESLLERVDTAAGRCYRARERAPSGVDICE